MPNMHQATIRQSRRQFLSTIGKGALLASSASLSSASVWSKPLDFRQNAPLLQLHFNENSLGMSPKALLAAQSAVENLGNRYPTQSLDLLKQALAAKLTVNEQQVILGNGSTDIIGAIVSLAASRNATVIEPTPTFGDVRGRAQAKGLKVIQVPVGKDFVTDIGALRQAAQTTSGNLLINICNPNNPTGTIVDQSALENWINSAPDRMLFLIDEAYFEYAQQNSNYASALPMIKANRENIVITRTFSKIYGMAGMRVGYGVAAPKTAQQIDALAAGFNLSTPGVAAALASLEDQTFYNKSLSSNNQAKSILINTLDELKLQYIPGNTNFVLHKINSDLASYAERMKLNGIKVGRRMTKDDGWNRISIGRPDEMTVFSQTLKAFRQQGWV